MAELESRASEVYAFHHLGFTEGDIVCDEQTLISCYAQNGIQVPEAIFYNPHIGQNVSIEVKRIPGNVIPTGPHEDPRKLRRRNLIVWPWKRTVESAIIKAHPKIVQTYNIRHHHVVIVVPECLCDRQYKRIARHVQTTVESFLRANALNVPKLHTHIIRGPNDLFDRF